MKKLQMAIVLSSALLLGACNSSDGNTSEQGSVSDGEAVNGSGTVDHGIDETKVDKAEADKTEVGFSLSGDTIEEAENIPAVEKEEILQAFDAYIETLNEQDVEGHLATLSKEMYDLEEEREFIEEQLSEYDVKREASTVTVVKYSDTEAQVFAELLTTFKQLSTGLETKPTGRQVTVFTKDDGVWKVASLHYIGDQEKK